MLVIAFPVGQRDWARFGSSGVGFTFLGQTAPGNRHAAVSP